MAHDSFTIEAMIHGYHVHSDIWNAVIDEELPCAKESGTGTFAYRLQIPVQSHRRQTSYTCEGKKFFAGSYLRTLWPCSKHAKICTIRKFPAIQYYIRKTLPRNSKHHLDIYVCMQLSIWNHVYTFKISNKIWVSAYTIIHRWNSCHSNRKRLLLQFKSFMPTGYWFPIKVSVIIWLIWLPESHRMVRPDPAA